MKRHATQDLRRAKRVLQEARRVLEEAQAVADALKGVPMNYKDEGYSVEHAQSGLSASITLQTVKGQEHAYAERERYWRAQLTFAERREAAPPAEEDAEHDDP